MNMSLQYCFFDLDGTIIDSSEGILASVSYALDKMGLAPLSGDEGYSFIGPPLARSFSLHRGLSDEAAAEAVRLDRENYNAGGMLQCRVYDGVESLLNTLAARGIQCVLATCKPHVYARPILEHHGLLDRFCFLSGAELSGVRGEKHEVIAYALEQLSFPNPSTILMVGDRADDVLGAAKNKIQTLGALWGFGSEEELLGAGAMHVFKSPDLLAHFFGNT